jgi:eukaryotic-like serine/threonine-protein kinase
VSEAFEEFGPYLVYERLGQGGMATVHRAEKRGTGIRKPIALKRLLPHVAADPDLVKLFVDEARLASHLHHANVAQTYELGRVNDIYFIAMEYASGPTLSQIVRQCQMAAGSIPPAITVNILSQVCEALDYAHNLCDDRGEPLRMIHRDVSPGNIIVTNTGLVKLIDFGIAKATISSTKTQAGFIKGKFGYIAPEYISGRIDKRVDLFAVGVVAHELLAGRRLFEGADDFETLQNIRDMVMQPPSQFNAQVGPDLDAIVMTALTRDPDQRWQSAAAMQAALATVARKLGVVVGGPQLAEWIEWAFSQEPGDSGPIPTPVARPAGDMVIRRRDSSVSINLRAAGIEPSPPPERVLSSESVHRLEGVDLMLRELGIEAPAPQPTARAVPKTRPPPPPQPSKSPSAPPIVTFSPHEPTPAPAIAPREPTPAPRLFDRAPTFEPPQAFAQDHDYAGQDHDYAAQHAQSSASMDAAATMYVAKASDPPAEPATAEPRIPQALVVEPDPSETLHAAVPPPPLTTSPLSSALATGPVVALTVKVAPLASPARSPRPISSLPLAPKSARASRRRATPAEGRPETSTETRRRRRLLGILLILALGIAAMAAAYYWPDL